MLARRQRKWGLEANARHCIEVGAVATPGDNWTKWNMMDQIPPESSSCIVTIFSIFYTIGKFLKILCRTHLDKTQP